jgi:hypothetical protein
MKHFGSVGDAKKKGSLHQRVKKPKFLSIAVLFEGAMCAW